MSVKTALEKLKEAATELVTLEKETKVKLAMETLDNGTVIEAESFEAGNPVFIVNEEEKVPLPIGEYEFSGKMLVVSEDGIIGEIKDVEAAPEEDTNMESDFVTKTEFNEAIDSIKAMFSKDKKEIEDKAKVDLEKAEDKNVKLQKELDEKPDAISIKVAPKVKLELQKLPASDKKGRINQFLNSK